MGPKGHRSGRTGRLLALLVCHILITPIAAANGVLIWVLGDLEPGESGSETVLFAYAEAAEDLSLQREVLIHTIQRARTHPRQSPVLTARNHSGRTWLANGVTTFVLDGRGSFFYRMNRMGILTCRGVPQLANFNYYVHYTDGGPKRAGIPINSPDMLENLRVLRPLRPVSSGSVPAEGLLETEDKKLEVRIQPVLYEGPVAGVTFRLTNTENTPLQDVRLSAYANIDANGHSGDDYSVLDPAMGGLLVTDLPTGMCVAMAGLGLPAAGCLERKGSKDTLLPSADETPLEQWTAFEGVPPVPEKGRRAPTIPLWAPGIGIAIVVLSQMGRILRVKPKYDVLARTSEYEIRRYPTCIAAQTQVSGEFGEASSRGRRLLADYALGDNLAGARITRTTPTMSETEDRTHTVSFIVPAHYALDALPRPRNSFVSVRDLPERIMAVRRFKGRGTEEDMQTMVSELWVTLERDAIEVVGPPIHAHYDPPWTLPVFRRNEVMLPVRAPALPEGYRPSSAVQRQR